jgi:hypothetical protein
MPTRARLSAVILVLGVLSVILAVAVRDARAQRRVGGAAAVGSASATGAGDPRSPSLHELDALHDAQRACERRMVSPLARVVRTQTTAPFAGDSHAPVGDHSPSFDAAVADVRELGDVEFLVATVPDPTDTGLYYLTDRLLEALQRGVEATDHEPADAGAPAWRSDHFWAPWQSPSDAGVPDDVDAKCRHLVPGMLLFRNDRAFGLDASKPLLVVFLVGETPTWGVEKVALEEALDFIDLAKSPRAGREVRIVGPTFSGSASSLRFALREWVPPAGGSPCFTVVSGNATSQTAKRLLETCDAASAELSCTKACAGQSPDELYVHFHATTVPDDLRERNFWTYLHEHLGVEQEDAGARCTQRGVAVLEESGTAYGDFAIAEPKQARRPGERPPEPPAARQRRARAEAGTAPAPPAVGASSAPPAPTASPPMDLGERVACQPEITLRFPPHISNVRRAYESQRPAGDPAASALLPALDPSLDEPSEPSDIVPNLSPRTAFSNDVVLAAILDELSQRNVRFVGFVASDPSDVIFLASQTKARLPDVRLFTFGSEILLAHPRYQSDLNGMMVVTAYPLLGAHEVRGSGDGGTSEGIASFFSSEQEEGVYNATVAVLGRPRELLEYERPGDAGADQPAVWVTVIGRDGPFPLYVGDHYDDPNDFVLDGGPEAPRRMSNVSPPHMWRFAFLVLTILAGYKALLFLYMRVWSALGGGVPRWPPLAPLFARCHASVAPRRDYCVTLLFAILLAGYGEVVRVETVPTLPGQGGRAVAPYVLDAAHVLLYGLAGCLVVSLLETILAGVRLVRASRALGARAVATEVLQVALLVVPATLVGGAAVRMAFEPAPAGVDLAPFYVRATNLPSGVSPVMPWLLFFALFYTWALCNLARLRIVSQASEPMPGAAVDKPGGFVSVALGLVPLDAAAMAAHGPHDIPQLEQDLVATMRYPTRRPLSWSVFAPMWLLPAYALFLKRPTTLESTWTIFQLPPDRVFQCFLGVSIVILSFAIVQLGLVWRSARDLFRRLVRHPLADAYGRLPRALVRSLEMQLSGIVPRPDDLAIAVPELHVLADGAQAAAADDSDAGRALAAAMPAGLAADLRARADAAAKLFLEERAATVARGSIVDLGRSAAVRELLRACAALSTVLAGVWSKRSLGTKPSAKGAASAWVKVAEDLVAMHVTSFVYPYVHAFQYLMAMAVGTALLFMLALASYCFEPHHLLGVFSSVTLLSAVAVVLYVFVGMERDELLSRIARTSPGRVTFSREFVMRIVTWAVIPVGSFVVVHYPQLASAVMTWLDPVLHALR